MKAFLATGIFYNDFSGLKICIVVLCVMPPCGLVGGYRHFCKTCFFHL